MYSENQKRKEDIYSTTCFSVFPFSSCKRKNENIYNGSYFYFSFFVCGLRKKKRILMYPFPIFYHEIEKRKTKGRYIHGPGLSRFLITVVLYREHKYQSTSDGHKSHLCFLIIANRKTNRGWFGSLFVFPTEWHQTGKQWTACTEEVVFLYFFLFGAANEKWK